MSAEAITHTAKIVFLCLITELATVISITMSEFYPALLHVVSPETKIWLHLLSIMIQRGGNLAAIGAFILALYKHFYPNVSLRDLFNKMIGRKKGKKGK